MYHFETLCKYSIRGFLLGSVLLCSSVLCTSANAGVLITETFNHLGHGQIVSASNPSQTAFGQFNGFTVSGNNLHDTRDWIVAFDTFRSATSDPDLQDPFSGPDGRFNTNNNHADNADNGNAASHYGRAELINTAQAGSYPNASRFQSALIIQEHGVGTDTNNNGFIDSDNSNQNDNIGVDDEGRRPAGSMTFNFENLIDAFGFDLLDVEGPLESFSLEFFKAGSLLATVGFNEFVASNGLLYDSTLRFGNNTANRIVPITAAKLRQLGNTTIQNFDQVTINLGGSGAIDNVKYSSASGVVGVVPEPVAITVWSLLGLTVLSPRRRKQSV